MNTGLTREEVKSLKHLLRSAASDGNIELVKKIMFVDGIRDDSLVLRIAANNGQLDMMKYLMSVIPNPDLESAFIGAVTNEYEDAAKYIAMSGLKLKDPHVIIDLTKDAIENNMYDIVVYLFDAIESLGITVNNYRIEQFIKISKDPAITSYLRKKLL